MGELLRVEDLTVRYRGRDRRPVTAVDGVSLTVSAGEIVGVVGESGCGKSTLARAMVGLQRPASGRVEFDGRPVSPLGRRARAAADRRLQMVFQDPATSLNPRRRIGDQVADGVDADADTLLRSVGLPVDAEMLRRYPHEFSGGQRQRIAIARALGARPRGLVADEPISALDASSQLDIARVFARLARDPVATDPLGIVFISHDLSIVRRIADRIVVMYLGTIVESGSTEQLWTNPSHPYTRALIESVPVADGSGMLPKELGGDIPDPAAPPPGCRFHPRCEWRRPECTTTPPPARLLADGREVAGVLHTAGAGLNQPALSLDTAQET
jgi:peptide/nickel transport system ATP-binding protein